ncbi:ABC transporter permease [Rhizobium sp. BK418]|uniref:ABC transporter permease n=1 Tax=Rhizobium sp. BK418 TaxID=2512120 RepID=UPI0010DB969B|nr:ABC transporter permease [Rhizobium sp. BK418]TCR94748.1 monosaccharide ABC transporter membrane protein (CUT2 family) [Rhizobium sp. BK418]
MSKFGAVGKLTPFLAAFALIIIFSFMHDAFLTWPNIWNIVRQSSVLLVAAMGITFVILIGSIDLSVGSIMTLSAICAVTLVPTMGEAGIIVGLLVGGLCGAINGTLNAVLKLPSFLVTLGTLFIFQSLGLIISGGRPLPWNTPVSSMLAGGVAFGSFPKIGLWAMGVLIICALVARFTRFGQYMYAIGDNERTTKMSGIDTTRMKILVFMVAGLISGLAGILLGIRTFSASPGMGDPFLLDTIAAVVLGGTLLTGGVGGPLRTVLGVLTIVILANGMTLLQVDPFYQVGIRGAVVILAVLVTTRRSRLDAVVK